MVEKCAVRDIAIKILHLSILSWLSSSGATLAAARMKKTWKLQNWKLNEKLWFRTFLKCSALFERNSLIANTGEWKFHLNLWSFRTVRRRAGRRFHPFAVGVFAQLFVVNIWRSFESLVESSREKNKASNNFMNCWRSKKKRSTCSHQKSLHLHLFGQNKNLKLFSAVFISPCDGPSFSSSSCLARLTLRLRTRYLFRWNISRALSNCRMGISSASP